MNEKALKTLEYYKIINQLANYATSQMGKELCNNLKPIDDIDEIKSLQKQTSDALSLIWKKGSLSFYGIHDIRPSLKRLSIGSALSASELIHIHSVLDVALRAKTYYRSDDIQIEHNSIEEMFNGIEPLSPLNNEIKRCIVSEDEISDEASPELKNIRRKIRNANEQIHSALNSMLNSSARTYLQDNVITMRNGRYCIPVKQEYRGQVQGLIHDQSSSGSTLFIEPMAVVKLNNEIKELYGKEQEEIEVILAKLSNLAGEHREILESNLAILVQLDFIFAKASYSKALKCSEPELNKQGIVELKEARHPLLDQKQVVPIDIYLGINFTMLIVTGPNTGGKTVSLKTLGLLTLMGQSGLHIPVFQGSKLAVFREVYADIGDEQSIEQSLSTFSSHMTNTVKILENADDSSLVLFDELGAGTDPTEGAALAMSILSFLHNMKVRTMVTTHYSELKAYALSTEGVENACCEFNVESLRPTYRLLIGIPGKSNAFAISEKLGLPRFIIEDAKNRVSEEDVAFEDIITDLESKRVLIDNEREEILKSKEEVDNLKYQLKNRSERLEERRERILREANEEAYKILQDAKNYADVTIKKFNKLSNEFNTKGLENERNLLRSKLSDTESKLAYKTKNKAKKKHDPNDFKVGDLVKVLTLGLEGTVSTLPNAKGDLYVQMGALRSLVNVKDLEILEDAPTKDTTSSRTNTSKIKVSKSYTISPEINLIGKTVDEAIAQLDKYLDDAYLSHLAQVRVVHGKGTGALRNAVHAHVKKLKYVSSYRLGVFGEGEAGVTIVEFKQ